MTDYYYDSSSVDALEAFVAAFLGFFMFIFMITFLIAIITIIFEWKVFAKAGKPGWAVLIPVYNLVVMFEIASMPVWNILLLLIPFVNIYIIIRMFVNISRNFGKPGMFALGLFFLPVIFWGILAFDNSTYNPVIEKVNSDLA